MDQSASFGVAGAARRSTQALAVMLRSLLALPVLVACASCVPVKTTFYEAVDRPRVAAGTEGNLFSCPPIGGYGLGSVGAVRILVDGVYDHGLARVELRVYIWRSHQVAFEAQELHVISLEHPEVTTSLPLAFYENCRPEEVERFCRRLAADVRTLTGSDSPRRTSDFIAVANVPSEFVNGFLLTLPAIVDGTSRIGDKTLRFELRTMTLTRGLGGCE